MYIVLSFIQGPPRNLEAISKMLNCSFDGLTTLSPSISLRVMSLSNDNIEGPISLSGRHAKSLFQPGGLDEFTTRGQEFITALRRPLRAGGLISSHFSISVMASKEEAIVKTHRFCYRNPEVAPTPCLAKARVFHKYLAPCALRLAPFIYISPEEKLSIG